MCGIAGVLRLDGSIVPPGIIEAMVSTLRHRGPDGEGVWMAPGGHLGFGHTRLAIIDLTPASDQPILDEAAGLSLIFNGEIYNYIELREELRVLGHEFRSDGDGEVILRAYDEWGLDCLPRLNGMFAFALWDSRREKLVLARDRFGEKPLFIAQSPRGLLFASEMKAILAVRPELRQANSRALYRYLARGDLDLDQETFFDGIETLPPAHYMVIGPDGVAKPKPYWKATSADVPTNPRRAMEGFRELLFDSIRLRLRSDVPVGSSLSGGMDSSSIVATIDAQKTNQSLHQKTFSARFRSARHDEGRFIATVTNQVEADSHEVWVEAEGVVREFAEMQWHQEEPIASASPYAQWCVMRLAKENETTVLLDGQGADEMLAGYDQAQGMFWAHWLRSGRIDRVMTEVLAYSRRYHGFRQPALFAAYYMLPGTMRDGLAERYYRSADLVSPELHREFAPAHVRTYQPFPDRLRNELVRWQTTTQLPEFLRYADRNSMAFGREVRLPFLDHRLVEYAFGLKPELLLNKAVTKVALRGAMRGIVPDEILDRKEKLAYAPPQEQWMHGALLPWMDGLLRSAEKRTEVFNSRAVLKLREALRRRGDDGLAWRVASTEMWFQAMVDEPRRGAFAGQAEISALNW
ncbi:MAG: asparagine synthase (glutamine-hydrolyzing) [Dehalococcoidia bacterium]